MEKVHSGQGGHTKKKDGGEIWSGIELQKEKKLYKLYIYIYKRNLPRYLYASVPYASLSNLINTQPISHLLGETKQRHVSSIHP